MIDWLTLRTPLQRLSTADKGLCDHLLDKLQGASGLVVCTDCDGREIWSKIHFDYEQLRSDTPGLFWTIQSTGENHLWLVIGGSPASVEHGNNVFGSGDIQHCARVMVAHARKVLQSWLPPAEEWVCRRIDVTHNYAQPNAGAVKGALADLLRSARARRYRATSAGDTDTVAWNSKSDLRAGKCYHKGPQLEMLSRKGATNATGEQIELANRLLRAELKLGARWFRNLEESMVQALTASDKQRLGSDFVEKLSRSAWWNLTEEDLDHEHESFFGGLLGDVEVRDMGDLIDRLKLVAKTPGQGLAAHRTWALMKTLGTEQTRTSMPASTFRRHCALLRAAGLSDTDLMCAEIVQFARRSVRLIPVSTWDDLRRAA